MKNFEASSFFGEKTRKHCFCEKVAQVIEKNTHKEEQKQPRGSKRSDAAAAVAGL